MKVGGRIGRFSRVCRVRSGQVRSGPVGSGWAELVLVLVLVLVLDLVAKPRDDPSVLLGATLIRALFMCFCDD